MRAYWNSPQPAEGKRQTPILCIRHEACVSNTKPLSVSVEWISSAYFILNVQLHTNFYCQRKALKIRENENQENCWLGFKKKKSKNRNRTENPQIKIIREGQVPLGDSKNDLQLLHLFGWVTSFPKVTLDPWTHFIWTFFQTCFCYLKS